MADIRTITVLFVGDNFYSVGDLIDFYEHDVISEVEMIITDDGRILKNVYGFLTKE